MNAPRRRRQPRPDDGSVLIIIAGVLAALSLMAITFSALARIEMRVGQNAHDKQMAIAAAYSGVGIAQEMLAQDETLCDDWRDPWYTPQYDRSDRISRPKPGEYGSHRCVTIAEGTLRGVSEIGKGINEDPPGDANDDGAPGIAGVDDDEDGLVDEDSKGRQPGEPGYSVGSCRNDDDEDGRIDEDPPGDCGHFGGAETRDGSPGRPYEDDDGDSRIDEGPFLNHDNDGDGKVDEDPPGDYVLGPKGTLWSEDRFDEGNYDSFYTEDFPGTPCQRIWYHANLSGFMNWQKARYIDEDRDGLYMEIMWIYSSNFDASSSFENGQRQVYPFVDQDCAEGQRRIDEDCDGCADGWGTTIGSVYYSTGGNFWRSDEDSRTYWWREKINVQGFEPEGTGEIQRFRSFAGRIPGMNAEDDDEDSDNVTLDENQSSETWWKVCRPMGFIRDDSSKINLNAHGSLYDPALFFDPVALRDLDGSGAVNSAYTGYAQHGTAADRQFPFHDNINATTGSRGADGSRPETITRKDIYAWARDGRMHDQSFDVSLVRFFRAYGFSPRQSQNFALAVVRYRYGPDGKPGMRHIPGSQNGDDDHDHWRYYEGPSRTYDEYAEDPNDPRGAALWNGIDDDGDWRGWHMHWIGSSSTRLPMVFQDQGIDPRYVSGKFVENSYLATQSVFWPGRYDNCPTCIRLTGCPRIDGDERRQTARSVEVTGKAAQFVVQEGHRLKFNADRWTGNYSDDYPSVLDPREMTYQTFDNADIGHPSVDELPDVLDLYVNNNRGEGIDEDDEYDPLNPKHDDRRFRTVGELASALLEKRDPRTGISDNDGECAVSYARNDGVDNDYDMTADENDTTEEHAEAARVTRIVEQDISVGVANLDLGLVNINVETWDKDGLDNDGDNLVDEDDEDLNDPAIHPTGLPLHGETPECPAKVRALADAYERAGIRGINMITQARSTLHWGVYANIVDFQDEDPFPTVLYYPNSDRPVHFGAEGVHLNEVMFGGERAGKYSETNVTLQLVNGKVGLGGEDHVNDGWKPLDGVPGMFYMNGNWRADGTTWEAPAGSPGPEDMPWIEARFVLTGVPNGYYVPMIYGNPQLNNDASDAARVMQVAISGTTRLDPWMMEEFRNDATGWEGTQWRKLRIFNDTDEHVESWNGNPIGTTCWLMNNFSGTPTQQRLGAARIRNESQMIRVRVRQPVAAQSAGASNGKAWFGIRLLNWHMEFVNISRKPIKLVDRYSSNTGTGLTVPPHYLSYYNGSGVNLDDTVYLDIGSAGGGAGRVSELPLRGNTTARGAGTSGVTRPGALWCPPGLDGTEGGDGQPAGYTKYIPAAHANGQFPTDYGYFGIALSEDAYDKTYGYPSGVGMTVPSGTWGDHPAENYPMLFLECAPRGDSGSDVPAFITCGRSLICSSGGPVNDAGIRLYAKYDNNHKCPLAGGLIDAFDTTLAGGGPISINFDLSDLWNRTEYPEYVSIEKIAPIVPIWKRFCLGSWYTKFNEAWRPRTGSGAGISFDLKDRASQTYGDANQGDYQLLHCVNFNWEYMSPAAAAGSARNAQDQNEEFISDERVAPMVLDGPFPSVGFLGFVPACEWGVVQDSARFSEHPWRNMTPRPHMCSWFRPGDNPLYTLLGMRVGRADNEPAGTPSMGYGSYPYTSGAPNSPGNWRPLACVPGVRAKINVNTASVPVLVSVFPSGIAAKIVKYRPYRCVEDLMGFPTPDGRRMLDSGQIVANIYSQRETFVSGVNVKTGYVDPYAGASAAQTRQTNYVPERDTRDHPFFGRYAFETYSIDRDLRTAEDRYRFPDRNKDHDDSGAGFMLDDVACDMSEQLEWFLRYCSVIDIKSQFFTVYSRGRVFGPMGLCADARVRAVLHRKDVDNTEDHRGLDSVAWYSPDPFDGPNGRADGVTIENVQLIDD